jgi:branched-chain amino acid transport system ATP-binding protein
MSAEAAPLLQVRDATKRYGGVMAVQDISFDVRRGEILGLIGPNGAGKTTLINLITGVAQPTRGTITFDGTLLNGRRPHVIGRMGVARTFQVVRPFANLTVLQNVAVGAMYGAGGAKRSAKDALKLADEVLEFVHLAPRRDDPAESLPIAGRKRLELAKALAMEPRLLLLDEAMAGLRGAEVDEAMDLVRKVSQRGITLLIIEHVMKVIMGVCERVVVLDYGKKIAEGGPAEVTTNPAVIEAYLGKRYSAAQGQPPPLETAPLET